MRIIQVAFVMLLLCVVTEAQPSANPQLPSSAAVASTASPTPTAPLWTDVLQARAAVATLIVAAVGFFILFKQVRQLERAIRGDTHTGLYAHSFELMKLAVDKPDIWSYFHGNKELSLDDPNYQEVVIITEMTADFFEQVALQRNNLPGEVWEKWRNYLQSTYKTSPCLRAHFAHNHAWYSHKVISLFEKLGQ